MSKDEEPPEGVSAATPSMLDLIHLSRRPLFPPGGVDLYRQIAILTEIGEGQDVLDVACGQGVTIEYFVRQYGVHGSGVESDSLLLAEAEERARLGGLGSDITFQHARADDLPFVDEVFDLSIGELGFTAGVDPRDAIEELVRVTKTGGIVVLIQLGWKASVDENRQRVLPEQLGARPVWLVEVKHSLMEAGVGQLHTEDWSDEATAFRPRLKKPFPDFAELFTFSEKLGILRRARKRWGWRGVRAALTREFEVHRLLTKERILGLDLIMGRKGAVTKEEGQERTEQQSLLESSVVSNPPADDMETEGLPLFQSGEEDE